VGDCSEAKPTFGPASQGCVSLISSGTSGEESAFLDASESGDDVFFLTSARLTASDLDTSLDLYDARVDGGFPEAIKPVECSGDACQAPASPPSDPTPASLSFQGAGNLVEPKPKKHHKKKRKRHGGKKHKRSNRHAHRGGQR
jgi:hypothetical protein